MKLQYFLPLIAFILTPVHSVTFSGASATISNPLEASTVSLVLPTESVQGSLPTFSDLPDCAQYCATNATTKLGGSVADLDLLCKNESVISSDRACSSALCSPTDQQTTNDLAPGICQPVGGSAPINSTVNPSGQQTVISAAYPTTTVVASIDDVPPCAKPCLVTTFRDSGCALDDIPCQCSSTAFTNLFTDCQAADCGVLDLQRLLPFTVKRCASVAIAIPSSVLSIESDIAYHIPTSTELGLPQPFGNLTNASSTGNVPPRATLFTGNAAMVRLRVVDYVVGVAMWFTWLL